MMDFIYSMQNYWLWLILAAVLASAEIAIAPGIFLIFIAIAAGLTGLVTMVLPLSATIQLALFAILSLAAVYVGRYWYASHDHPTSDPMLNDRSARMIGKVVIVTEPVSASGGRVRVGDGEWPARGPELPVGASARIASVENGIVMLEIAD